MVKVLFLLGTRPEAIKLAPVIKAFNESAIFDTKICSTSQHREMLDQVLAFFQINVDFDLNLMRPNQTLAGLTAEIVSQVSSVLKTVEPDWLVVQGDTTTALAGAMAGFYEKVKVVHVEAGLRSFDMQSPFPEEMNRVIISKLASCHFCPTEKSMRNLLLEGITNNVYCVGNTVVDAVVEGVKVIQHSDQSVYFSFFKNIDFAKKIILVTCHRRESFGEPFKEICEALRQLVEHRSEYQIVYPVHLNPNIRTVAMQYLQHPSIKLLEPLSYPFLLWLMSKSTIILTDSGGIQEEAPSLKKPVLVLRSVTERTEGIEAGTAILVGTDKQKIVEESILLLDNEIHYNSMISKSNPYGDGHAAIRMLETMKKIS